MRAEKSKENDKSKRTTALLRTKWQAPWPSREIQAKMQHFHKEVQGDAYTPVNGAANVGMMDAEDRRRSLFESTARY